MRILLLGAAGQLGRELRPRLADLGEVVAYGRRAGEGLGGVDFEDSAALRATVRACWPALIVNACAVTDVDGAERDPERAMRVNAEGPALLAQEATRCGALLVHYSTDYVFDGSGEKPWREDDPQRPLSAYGRSKAAGDAAVRSFASEFLVLRPSWIYSGSGRNFVTRVAELACSQEELRVVSDQIGAPTPASFVAETTCAILRLWRGGKAAGPLREQTHVACAGEASRLEIAQAILGRLRALGRPVRATRVTPVTTAAGTAPAPRPLNSRLDLGRLRERFGVTPPDWRALLPAELDVWARRSRATPSRPSLAVAEGVGPDHPAFDARGEHAS